LETYVAILAARSFRVRAAIAARFDLEIKQYDVINAFINAKRDPSGLTVVYKLLDGFKVLGKYVEIDRALYGLRDSPTLWYKEFKSTLLRVGLSPLKEEPCIFVSTNHKVFVIFFVDDVQVLNHESDEALVIEIVKGIDNAY